MIVGIGTDIVEICRLKEAVEEWGERFLKKVFTAKEIAYCYEKKNPFPHLAARFAAKEAFIKALSQQDRRQNTAVGKLNFKDIEILNQSSGKPFINIHNYNLLTLNPAIIHLSLSHERNYAIATVVLERKEN